MSETERAHLDSETIHGLLDAALSASEAARAEAHHAVCPACAAEVASLRVVFASLASLPEEPLRIDLRAGVMGGIAPVRRPALKAGWLLAAQVLSAAIGLWIARPWMAGLLEPIAGFPLTDWITSALLTFVDDALGAWRSLAAPAADAVASLAGLRWGVLPGAVSMPQVVGLVLAAITLCVVGNGLLLRAARSGSRNGGLSG